MIGVRWLIEAWERIPISLWTLLQLLKFRPNLELWTPHLLQKYFQTYEKCKNEHVWEIWFLDLKLLEIRNLKTLEKGMCQDILTVNV